jgi:hypothetical protein
MTGEGTLRFDVMREVANLDIDDFVGSAASKAQHDLEKVVC